MTWPLKTPLLKELSKAGHVGFSLSEAGVPVAENPKNIPLRKIPPALPEISELEAVRHFTRLSHLNYSIDGGMYPLGSCTMKYNPRVNEKTASDEDFLKLHPLTPWHLCQGALELMYRLEKILCEISGFKRVSLQPAAGAQGEYTGLRMFQSYLETKKNPARRILIPDSAHGTNPATAAMCGFEPVELKSTPRGLVNLSLVEKEVAAGGVAGIMITNPNTLGLFESEIEKISRMIHSADGLVYCDGANLNALLGLTRPGDAAVDVMHFNMHKTFTTPHGGGGPGCGGVGVSEKLVPFLPLPLVGKNADGTFFFENEGKQSIGHVKDFYGHFLMMVRAYTYIRELGPQGLKKVAEDAILLANYVRMRLREHYEIAFDAPCMHEVVYTDKAQQKFGIKTLDIAKRLIDLGYHPPTIYFPLLVSGALMIEPTETESLSTVEDFCKAMIQIANEARETSAYKKYFEGAPLNMPFGKINETKAAKELLLTWRDL